MIVEELVKKISNSIFEKKGSNVKLINLIGVSTIADYFILCSGDSDSQVKAISDNIEKSLRDEGIKIWHKEGYSNLNWVLLDYVDVVVHIFKPETREFYNLEKLWGDAEISELNDPQVEIEKKSKKRITKKSENLSK